MTDAFTNSINKIEIQCLSYSYTWILSNIINIFRRFYIYMNPFKYYQEFEAVIYIHECFQILSTVWGGYTHESFQILSRVWGGYIYECFKILSRVCYLHKVFCHSRVQFLIDHHNNDALVVLASPASPPRHLDVLAWSELKQTSYRKGELEGFSTLN